MTTLIHDRVAAARKGENDTVVCRLSSGWLVLGDVQFLHGYCLLLADPVVESINQLSAEQRKTFLYEMSVIGDALLALTDCYRVNYEILGNSEPALHAHIFPRYNNETDELRGMPAWFYNWQAAPKFDKNKLAEFSDKLKAYLSDKGLVLAPAS